MQPIIGGPVRLWPNAPRRDLNVTNAMRDGVSIVALLLTLGTFALVQGTGSIDIRWDAATYYVLGTSLAHGTGYRLLNEPGNIQEVQYPPVVPVLIALHQMLAGTDDPSIVGTWLRASWLAMFALLAVFTYLLVIKSAPWQWAFLAGLLVVCNTSLIFYASTCSADLPFALVTCMCIVVYRSGRGLRIETLTGLGAAVSYFTRTIGIALLGAWILDALLHKHYKSTLCRIAVTLGCVLTWNGYIRWVETSPEYHHPSYVYQRADYQYYNVSYARNMVYIDPFRPELGKKGFRDHLRMFANNLVYTPKYIGESISSPRLVARAQAASVSVSWPLPWVVRGALIIAGALSLAGSARLIFKMEWFIGLYIVLSVLAIISSPWPNQMTRYLVPLAPYLLLALFQLFRIMASSRSVRRVWTHLPNALVLLLASFLVTVQLSDCVLLYLHMSVPIADHDSRLGEITSRNVFYDTHDVALGECLEWITAHANSWDIIATALPQHAYLRTGLKAVMPPLEKDATVGNTLLQSVPVRYLILEKGRPNFASPYLSGYISEASQVWRLAHISKNRSVLVYEHLSKALRQATSPNLLTGRPSQQ